LRRASATCFTGDEIDAHQSVAGSAPITVKSDQDDLTGTASASLLFSMKSNLSMELAYNGEYGDETTAHSAWLRFHYLFLSPFLRAEPLDSRKIKKAVLGNHSEGGFFCSKYQETHVE
jgi:hypothetical protein